MVCMTYPLIGNYGMTDEDYETKVPTMGGLIVREYNDLPSNFRYTKTLDDVLVEYDIPAISGVDTRMITRIIRDEGSQKVIICDANVPYEEALKKVREYIILVIILVSTPLIAGMSYSTSTSSSVFV